MAGLPVETTAAFRFSSWISDAICSFCAIQVAL